MLDWQEIIGPNYIFERRSNNREALGKTTWSSESVSSFEIGNRKPYLQLL